MAKKGDPSSSFDDTKLTTTDDKKQRQLQQQTRIAEREAAQEYIERRQAEVSAKNRHLQAALQVLSSVLQNGLNRTLYFDSYFNKLIDAQPDVPPRQNIVAAPPRPPDKRSFQERIPKPGFFEKRLGVGGDRRRRKYDNLNREWHTENARYREELDAYEEYMREVKQRNDAIDGVMGRLKNGEQKLVEAFFLNILETSSYPVNFPTQIQIRFCSDTREMIIEKHVPTFEMAVPLVETYRYIKSRDEVQAVELSQTEKQRRIGLYAETLASIALRTAHEIFRVDKPGIVKSVVFNGLVDSVDRATGQDVELCLISIQTEPSQFSELDLRRIDILACIEYLKGRLVFDNDSVQPVQPIRTCSSVYGEPAGLQQAQEMNLLEVDPFKFEHLVADLFRKMGLRVTVTPPVNDGGIDLLVYDDRPVVGFEAIVQIKRYQGAVDVKEVRAFRGLIPEYKATKAIFVTTGYFTPASRKVAETGRVELIDGPRLISMFQEHGYNVCITPPSEKR